MAKTYQYCVAENWGKGFIDHVESVKITFTSFPGDVWQVPAYNKHANLWIAKVGGTVKTKDQAKISSLDVLYHPPKTKKYWWVNWWVC